MLARILFQGGVAAFTPLAFRLGQLARFFTAAWRGVSRCAVCLPGANERPDALAIVPSSLIVAFAVLLALVGLIQVAVGYVGYALRGWIVGKRLIRIDVTGRAPWSLPAFPSELALVRIHYWPREALVSVC